MKTGTFALILVVVTMGFTLLGEGVSMGEEADDQRPKLVVGVFDSRALAVAYASSDIHAAYHRDLKERHAAAKAAGDVARVEEIEAEAEETQRRFHRQGFSTAPVDDILEHIRDEIPAIAERAGVDLIVSKWDVAYQVETAKTIDVTLAMVAPLAPDERALKTIAELEKHPPVPLEEIDKHDCR